MLHKLNLDDILFLDIETVPLHQQYSFYIQKKYVV